MKEKAEAERLINQHCNILRAIMTTHSREEIWNEGKEHAIFTVDQIIKELKKLTHPKHTRFVLKWGVKPETIDGYENIEFHTKVREIIVQS